MAGKAPPSARDEQHHNSCTSSASSQPSSSTSSTSGVVPTTPNLNSSVNGMLINHHYYCNSSNYSCSNNKDDNTVVTAATMKDVIAVMPSTAAANGFVVGATALSLPEVGYRSTEDENGVTINKTTSMTTAPNHTVTTTTRQTKSLSTPTSSMESGASAKLLNNNSFPTIELDHHHCNGHNSHDHQHYLPNGGSLFLETQRQLSRQDASIVSTTTRKSFLGRYWKRLTAWYNILFEFVISSFCLFNDYFLFTVINFLAYLLTNFGNIFVLINTLVNFHFLLVPLFRLFERCRSDYSKALGWEYG